MTEFILFLYQNIQMTTQNLFIHFGASLLYNKPSILISFYSRI